MKKTTIKKIVFLAAIVLMWGTNVCKVDKIPQNLGITSMCIYDFAEVSY